MLESMLLAKEFSSLNFNTKRSALATSPCPRHEGRDGKETQAEVTRLEPLSTSFSHTPRVQTSCQEGPQQNV